MKIVWMILLVLGLASTSAGQVLLEEPFTDVRSKNYELWGAAYFNRVEPFKGKLELEGSTGGEGFGVYFRPVFDLAKTPLSITLTLVRNAQNQGSEICVWFVNQYLVKGSPWDEGDFVRVKIDSTDLAVEIQETSPEQRGMGTSLGKVTGAYKMGKPFDLEFRVTATTATVLVDGKELVTAKHHLTKTTGYLHLHDWNSLEGDIDTVSNFRVNVLK